MKQENECTIQRRRFYFWEEVGEINSIWENVESVNLESIITFDLEAIVTEFDQKIFNSLEQKEFEKCEDFLSDFCFNLLDLSEVEQVFIARTFFISIITDIIRIHNRRNLLHPRVLAHAYDVIARIEKWENLSEYLLSIHWFVERLEKDIIADQILFEGSAHVEKALYLISHHLEDSKLSVSWIAEQLDISTTHLSNLFKLQIGETVAHYITKRKIEEITYELIYTNKSLKEIREKFGYMNHSNFIQHFKRHQGLTPLQFRKKSYGEIRK